jgi:osmoprotectant transport system substrate-binding protein
MSKIALSVTGAALALAAAGCGSSSSGGTVTPGSSTTPSSGSTSSTSALCGGQTGSGKIVIGDAGFTENELLAQIYADALAKCGYTTSTKSFQSREIYYPAVADGKIKVVPEYAATLTDFINQKKNGANAATKASGDITTTVANLKAELPSSLAVLNPADATDKNAFAVKKSFATAHNLTTLSQLAAYSKTHPLKLAGPPECPQRPFCEAGLKSTYGMKFASFKQTDPGGPLTEKAIASGTADVGLVFTSDPTVASKGLVILTDDKQLQASDNVIPLVNSSLASGAAASALNAVDAKLDQATLIALNKGVEIDRGSIKQVAMAFLSQEGLTS